MNLKKVLFLFFLYTSIYGKEPDFSGVWFSDRQEFRNGFETIQLIVQDNKFTLAKLSFNTEKKWEEMKMLGVIEKKENGDIFLNPEMCSVYATKTLGLRWILFQGYDCDHYKIAVTKSEQGIIISPSIGIKDSLNLNQSFQGNSKKIQAKVISIENEKLHVWSLGMRYVKKRANAFWNGKKISIVETVDSTGTFETQEPVQLGDWITIESINTSLFE